MAQPGDGWVDIDEAEEAKWRARGEATSTVDIDAVEAQMQAERERELKGARALRSTAHGARMGGSLGFGDELGAAFQAHMQAGSAISDAIYPDALLNLLPDALRNRPQRDADGNVLSLAEVYRQARDANRAQEERVKAAAPAGYYLAGEIAGGAAIPVGNTAKGLAGLKGVGAATKTGMQLGGAAGLGYSDADLTRGEADGAALDALKGALTGGALAAGVHGGGRLLSKLYRGIVKPTEAAQRLRSRGVDLTLGQMEPQSWLGQVEEAAQSVDGLGAILQGQRQRGRESFQGAVLNEAFAPGATPAVEGTVPERLLAAYRSFEPAYSAVRAEQVRPLARATRRENAPLMVIDDAFEDAVNDPAIYATEEEVQAARRFLQNQASLLERAQGAQAAKAATGTGGGPATGGGSGTVPAGTVLQVRSNIRQAIADALAQENYTAARLLQNAEQSLSGGLEAQLPKAAAERLRATDRQYAKHKVISDAVRRSGDMPDGFTPAQLSSAVRAATEPGAYARGEGGVLRELAADGRQVLDMRSPPTGARVLTMPGVKYPAAGIAAWMNASPGLKRAALGEVPAQKAAVTAEEALRILGFLRAARQGVPVRAAGEAGE